MNVDGLDFVVVQCSPVISFSGVCGVVIFWGHWLFSFLMILKTEGIQFFIVIVG